MIQDFLEADDLVYFRANRSFHPSRFVCSSDIDMRNNKRAGQNYKFLIFGLCVLVFGFTDDAHPKEKILTVDVEITAPCVMNDKGNYTGFDIDLWEEIAQELGLAFTYMVRFILDRHH